MAAQEFVIRASGADKAAVKHLVARFPLAFKQAPSSEATANAPDLKDTGDWVMGQMEEAEAKPGTRGMPGQWVLEERHAGRPRFVGQPEGGVRDTGAGYFLLMKGKGNEFIAVPVSDLFTFKPALQRRHQSLEKAEATMQAQRAQHERANPRLAKAVARAEEDPLAILRDDEADGGRDEEDEEWREIKERAAARHVVKAAPKQQKQQQRPPSRAAAEEQPDGEDHAERDEKGEDWEHEDVAADDDLDMGEGEEEEDVGSPVRKGAASSDSEEEGEGGALQPEKAKRRLRRMMRDTGLEDSEDEEESAEAGEEESESIMDEEDLDRMAGVAPAAQRELTPETQLRPEAAGGGGGKKRKSPTPPPASAAAAVAGGAAAGAAEQGAKRPRTGPAGAGAAAVAATGAPAAAAASGSVTAEELCQLLRSKGRILLADLTAMYKSRLSGPEGTKAFVQLVKQVAKMEPGSKYLVLKD